MNLDELHRMMWWRYVRMPYGHVLDYADTEGNAYIPTACECENCIPNVMGWATAIADCAFFGGLYLYALCEKYDYAPSEKLMEEIHTLAKGLLLLCDVGKADGCIARGVADDGVSHYPTSSEDQVDAWAIGLWRLLHSPVADHSFKKKVTARLVRTLTGLKEAGWYVPTEISGVTRGCMAHGDWRGVSKLLICAAIARELGILSDKEYEDIVNEKPDESLYTRAEIASHGFAPDMVRNPKLIQFWICLGGHIGLRELLKLDPARAEYYHRGLHLNAVAVLPFLREYKKYVESTEKEFVYDWHNLSAELRECQSYEEKFKEAKRINSLWGKSDYNPMRSVERATLSQAFFGAWIAILSGEDAPSELAKACLLDALEQVDWNKVGQSYAFVLEAALISWEKANADKNKRL